MSLEPRFFVVLAVNRETFIKKNARKEVTTENMSLGDKVFAYFPYIKDTAEAVIVGLSSSSKGEGRFKVHFKGHSYRY